MLKYKSEILW